MGLTLEGERTEWKNLKVDRTNGGKLYGEEGNDREYVDRQETTAAWEKKGPKKRERGLRAGGGTFRKRRQREGLSGKLMEETPTSQDKQKLPKSARKRKELFLMEKGMGQNKTLKD